MRVNLKRNRTLLVDGPSSITLISGSASALGSKLREGCRVIVRNGKRLPVEAEEDSVLDLRLGEGASFSEIEGSAIPESWRRAFDRILAVQGYVSVMVMGGVDSGKTSFCIYLANIAVNEERRVAIIDGDVGQSEIGPPTTVSIARISKPIIDLFSLKAESMRFVGVTSPSKAPDKALDALKRLRDKSLEMNVNMLIINTDGWINGEGALEYRVETANIFSPDIIVAIQDGEELKHILDRIRDGMIIQVKPPRTVKRRSRDVRRALRELSYRKYLKDAKIQCYPLGWMRIEGLPPDKYDLIRRLREKAKMGRTETEDLSSFGEAYSKLKEMENMLVGLQDENEEFIGIGILCNIDPSRHIIRVYTPVKRRVHSIMVGQIKLDRHGCEILQDERVCGRAGA